MQCIVYVYCIEPFNRQKENIISDKMPPKKKGEEEEKMVLIGRMGTNLKVFGIYVNCLSNHIPFLVWYSWSTQCWKINLFQCADQVLYCRCRELPLLHD